MAAAGDGELAGDRGEDAFDFIAEPYQRRYGDHGDEGQDQGIFDQGLASPLLFSV